MNYREFKNTIVYICSLIQSYHFAVTTATTWILLYNLQFYMLQLCYIISYRQTWNYEENFFAVSTFNINEQMFLLHYETPTFPFSFVFYVIKAVFHSSSLTIFNYFQGHFFYVSNFNCCVSRCHWTFNLCKNHLDCILRW